MTLSEARAKGMIVDWPQNPRGQGAPYYGGPYGDVLLGHREYIGVLQHPKGGMLVRADGRGYVPAPQGIKVATDEDGKIVAIGLDVAEQKRLNPLLRLCLVEERFAILGLRVIRP